MDALRQEFQQWEKEFNAQTAKMIDQAEYNRPDNFYLMFDTPSDAQRALKLIEEYRQYDSRFVRMTDFKPDSKRDVGIEIDFDKSAKNTKDDMIVFLRNTT